MSEDEVDRAEEIAARMKKLGVKTFTYKDSKVEISAEFGPDYLAYGPVTTQTEPPTPGNED
mgnify:CR=1 FL=1